MTTHMKWSEELFGTGIPEVDEQHKELFLRVNALLDACAKGDGGKAVASTLEFLEGYMEQHFSEEEALMEARKCSAAEENKRAHDEFRCRYVELRASLLNCHTEAEMAQLILEVQETVCDWLMEHIMLVDTELKNSEG